MRSKIMAVLIATALVAPAAFAQIDEFGPGGTWDDGSFGTLLTPPLSSGEQFTAPIEYHPEAHFGSLSWGNWLGMSFGVSYDPTEVNFVGVKAGPGLLLTNPGGVPGPVATIWDPAGAGQLPTPSSVFTVANVTFDAKNTTTANNGDIDITFDGGEWYHPFNIYGATPFGATWTTNVVSSNMLYVGFTAGGDPKPATQWAPGVAMGEGTWIHATSTFEVLLQPGMWWGRIGDILPQGGIGVEHVPEPAAAAMLMVGIGVLVATRRRS